MKFKFSNESLTPCLPEPNAPSNQQPFLNDWSLFIQHNLNDRAVGDFIIFMSEDVYICPSLLSDLTQDVYIYMSLVGKGLILLVYN